MEENSSIQHLSNMLSIRAYVYFSEMRGVKLINQSSIDRIAYIFIRSREKGRFNIKKIENEQNKSFSI